MESVRTMLRWTKAMQKTTKSEKQMKKKTGENSFEHFWVNLRKTCSVEWLGKNWWNLLNGFGVSLQTLHN